MCVIFVQSAGAEVTPGELIAMRNLGTHGSRDGAGAMWVENGRIKYAKILGKTESEVLDLYKSVKHRTVAFHQRNQTKGPVNLENAHPFPISSIDDGDEYDIMMMHNGTIQDVQVDPTMSDSFNFAAYFLSGLLKKFPLLLDSPHFGQMLGSLITRSKFVFLRANGDPKDEGTFILVNFDEGRMLKPGVWVSRKEAIIPVSTKAAAEPAPLVLTPPTTTSHGAFNGQFISTPDGVKVWVPGDDPQLVEEGSVLEVFARDELACVLEGAPPEVTQLLAPLVV